jgi:Acylphosphatase
LQAIAFMATTSQSAALRYRIRLPGIVQGVGFRPFIYKLAIAKLRVSESEASFLIPLQALRSRPKEAIPRSNNFSAHFAVTRCR